MNIDCLSEKRHFVLKDDSTFLLFDSFWRHQNILEGFIDDGDLLTDLTYCNSCLEGFIMKNKKCIIYSSYIIEDVTKFIVLTYNKHKLWSGLHRSC